MRGEWAKRSREGRERRREGREGEERRKEGRESRRGRGVAGKRRTGERRSVVEENNLFHFE